MHIAHLTDLHARPHGLPANRIVESNKMIARAMEAVRALIPKPDCLIISGDLTDCGLAEEYAVLRKLLKPLDIPVYMVPGNHDRRENFSAEFHDYPGIPASGHVNYAIEDFPVRIIALDTVVPGYGHGALDEPTLDWLESTLARHRQKPTLIFMHHPPFNAGVADMDNIRLKDGSERFGQIVARNGQIEHVLCGHHHRPIHIRYAGTICSTGPSVAHQSALDFAPGTPGMIMMEPPAFQLHVWLKGQGLVSHMLYVEKYDGPYPFLTPPEYPGRMV